MPCEPVGPGRVSLLQLHALVPAAEELDLADEVHHEQLVASLVPREDLNGVDWRARTKAEDTETADRETADRETADRETAEDEASDDGSGEEPDPAEGEPLTEGQVRGLLEHQLGATPLPDDLDDPGATDAERDQSGQPGRPDGD